MNRVYLPNPTTRSLQGLHVALSIIGHHVVIFPLVSRIASCLSLQDKGITTYPAVFAVFNEHLAAPELTILLQLTLLLKSPRCICAVSRC